MGRGRSAGKGKTCGRGQKGQKSRSGYSRRAGFEGGQMPLHRRLPKRGFRSPFRTEYQVINLMHLASVSGEVDPVKLKQMGMIGHADRPVKILGSGEVKGALKITADAFSASARQKIEAAGGSCIQREAAATKKPKTAGQSE